MSRRHSPSFVIRNLRQYLEMKEPFGLFLYSIWRFLISLKKAEEAFLAAFEQIEKPNLSAHSSLHSGHLQSRVKI
jgi:hypothetical protein